MLKVYIPEVSYCQGYKEGEISATLATGYHFGSGGDAALIVKAITAKGDGNAWLGDHTTSLTVGGGKLGQGYQAVLIKYDSESDTRESTV